MKTEQHIPRSTPIPLWGPNHQDQRTLERPRGHKKGVQAIARYRRWKKLADRMRLFPPGGEK